MAISGNESAFINTKNNHFFKTILENMPDYVKRDASLEHANIDEPIVRTSYPVRDAFIILYGELVVVNEFESGKVYEPVAIYNNDFVGVVEIVLDSEEFISTVSATTKVEYLKIPKETFKRWIKENSTMGYMVLESVCSNFSKNMTDAGEQIVLDSMYLLVSHIIKNSKHSVKDSIYFLDETRDKTAKRTGINIRTLYRYIKKLKQLNFISLSKKKIAFNEDMKEKLIDYSITLRNK